MVAARIVSLAIVVLLAASPASAAANSTEIIVQREAGLSAAQRADIRADAEVRYVESLPLPRTELVAARPGDVRDAIRDLNADPAVVYAEANRPVQGLATDPHMSKLWGLENLGTLSFGSVRALADADTDAPEAWSESTGAGQTVAVVDSGVDLDHPDLAAHLVPGYDYVENDVTPQDEDDHGTHVAGTIAAITGNGLGVAGIAPDAQVSPLRVLDANGSGLVSDTVEAFADAGADGRRIVNASLGGDTFIRAERDVIAANPEVLFVVAAGNSGTSNDVPADAEYPCAYNLSNVLCVAASRHDDTPADFTNFGATTVDLFAPGYGIYSSVIDGYAWMSGTSMAAPHVAGAAALVLAAAPTLTPTQVKAVLMQSGDYKPAFAGLTVTGRRLNAAAAVELALTNGGPFADADGDGFRDTLDACPAAASSERPNGCPEAPPAATTTPTTTTTTPATTTTTPTTTTPTTTTPTTSVPTTAAPTTSAPATSEPTTSTPEPPPAQVSSISATATQHAATLRVVTSRQATVGITVERKSGRRWVRVTRKSVATAGNRATLKLKRLKRGTHRARAAVSGGTPVTKGFRVR